MKNIFTTRDILLALSILIFFSYLFQIYWGDVKVFENVVYIEEGHIQRFLIKFSGLILLYFVLLKYFSFKSFMYNFLIKVPLLYYILTVIFISPIFFTSNYPDKSTHILSLNLILFTPILFLNFFGDRGDELFLKLIKIIIWVVCFQLFVDIVFKILNLNLVTTIIGGMGNANTFGLHLIIASLGIRFVYHRPFLSNIILILNLGTGSMMCAIVSILFLTQAYVINFFKRPLSNLLIFLFLFIFLLIFWSILEDNFFSLLSPETGPIYHIMRKISEQYTILIHLITGEISISEAGNDIARIAMIIQAWKLFTVSPLSIIFGHPNFLPYWTADSFILALLVTLGLPILVLFLLSNIYLILRGSKNKTNLSKFASYTLFVYLMFFFHE